jgi:phospholipase C
MDAIGHVGVLMLEDHSFDQMLGSLGAVISGVDGVDRTRPKGNPDFPDSSIYQSETTLTLIPLDRAHEFVDVNHHGTRATARS